MTERRVVLATRNAHKLGELRAILAELGDLLDLAELGCRELTQLQDKALGR